MMQYCIIFSHINTPTMSANFIPELTNVSCQNGMVCFTLIGKGGTIMTFEQGLEYIRHNQRTWHIKVLRPVIERINPQGVFIEFPKLTRATLNNPFEMVIISSRELAACANAPTPDVFASATNHSTSRDVLKIPNLSGDTILLMPHPQKYADANCANISKFVALNDIKLINIFWAAFVETAWEEIANKGHVWISTHGLGVNWLHIRFARDPKYYCYKEYARMP